ncbi:hypothetical protein [Alkalimonas sp.]|uniref:hypothetical protein n=1 Tax=Alkalimonas sp. TaxID=1872453 RepID=UPI00263BD3A1|nr:hypothetical protein [Alkalimonas sp.]MCC5827684.1 hypothetical protein [Alkalimonas sp.]
MAAQRKDLPLNTGSKITAAAIVLVLLTLLVVYSRFHSDASDFKHADLTTKTTLEPAPPSGTDQPKHVFEALDPLPLPKDRLQQGVADSEPTPHSHPTRMAYEDDWCISFTDLHPQDFAYYQREREDWDISRGRIWPAILEGRVIGNHESSQYIAPYMEASYDTIRQQIQNDNEFAMVAALYRPDLNLDLDTQRAIAFRLVVKGHTSKALSHLVIIELVQAQTRYRRTNQVNKKAEHHLYRALAFTVYGIKHFDLDPALTYLGAVSTADFPLELKPRYALGADNRIQEYLDMLTQWIDEERANENLQLPTTDELPKAAKHDFESRLARLYLDFGSELNDLKGVLPDTASTLLKGSECVQRQVTFFGDLERRARNRAR